MQRLNDMPYDQYSHIYNLADNVARGAIPGLDLEIPHDLRVAAQQVKNEMAGSLAREIYTDGAKNVGVWNANAANNAMNARSMKLHLAMPPDEVQAFHTLNYGGQLMPGAHAYEGAGMQINRMAQMGLLERFAPALGAGIGGLTPIPGGQWMGGKLGEKVQSMTTNRRLLREAQNLDAQMEANAKLGNVRGSK
jgi:hypothetical protein